jgi:hypothetical protein
MVRSPTMVNSLPSVGVIFLLTKVIVGWPAASKKSGDLRWLSRSAVFVSIEAAAISTLIVAVARLGAVELDGSLHVGEGPLGGRDPSCDGQRSRRACGDASIVQVSSVVVVVGAVIGSCLSAGGVGRGC